MDQNERMELDKLLFLILIFKFCLWIIGFTILPQEDKRDFMRRKMNKVMKGKLRMGLIWLQILIFNFFMAMKIGKLGICLYL